MEVRMPKFYFRITSHDGFFQDALGEDHENGMEAKTRSGLFL
jgi:hypothetical protein